MASVFSAAHGRTRPAYIVLAAAVFAVFLNLVLSFTFIKDQDERARELKDRALALRGALSGKGSGTNDTALAVSFIKGLPESGELASVLEEVFKSAKRSGLSVATAEYNSETFKDSSISRYAFTFPVEGSYRDVKRFLYDVESSRRPLVIEELSLASGKAGEGKTALRIRMSVYYR